MGPNKFGHGKDRDEPAYWRRRVFALAAVVGTVGLVAWGCSAGASVPQTAPPSGAAGSPAAKQIAAIPTSPPATPTPRPARKAHSRAHPKRAHAKRAHAKRAHAKRAHAKRAHDARARRHRGECTPGKLVITLSASQQVYQAGTEPQFTIYVVNMGPRTCKFGAAPRSLRLVIKSGPVYSWGSGDCLRGSAPHMVRLSRGVPFVKHVTWNRERSEPGCHSPRTAARPGTYTATASYRTEHSKTDVFFLR